MNKAFLMLALPFLFAACAGAFVPSVPLRRSVPALSFAETAALGEMVPQLQQEAPSRILIPQSVREIDTKESPSLEVSSSLPLQQTPSKVGNFFFFNPTKVVVALGESVIETVQQGWKRLSQSLVVVKRPSNKFRLQLGVAAVSTFIFLRPHVQAMVTQWIQHRGFQGISAAGRSIAYGWALLVAYPRLLDRRAAEKQRLERQAATERQRQRLRRLAAEVARLRTELASLDKEIRTFRREIITLKAHNNNNGMINDDVQEAITAEMAHLASLRKDTQAALTAVRHSWAEVRSQTPPELWQEEDDLLLEPPPPPTTIG